eukprot:3149274-Pyramimonas_sp.AAC.1
MKTTNSDSAQYFLEESLRPTDSESRSGQSTEIPLDKLAPCLYQDLEENPPGRGSKSTNGSSRLSILNEISDDASSLEVVVDAAEGTNHNLWTLEVGYPPPYHRRYRIGY